ncbi:class I SAM-dependent methyltransferase [Pseudahrensia aquimaris]|uniref:Class I SAM-dependent methyltransferase n=1 Tax=Pseudahrensia aquimaris TaxID=744461 RepID=A0ABW3FE21_9HYPH
MSENSTATQRIKARLARAKRICREGDDFLVRLAVDEMLERLAGIERHFGEALALFAGGEYLASQLATHERVGSVTRLEIDALADLNDFGLTDQSLDLIVAPLSLHFLEDLPGAFVQLRRALRPDGLLLAMLPGPETLAELRASLLQAESAVTGGAAQRVDAFTDIRDAGGLLQRAGFALPVLDSETVTVRYDNMTKLIADLRRMGASGVSTAGRGPGLNREAVAQAISHYSENFADADGRVRATFQLVSLSGWAPDASQQKPLKPGSAKARLADALKTDERKL